MSAPPADEGTAQTGAVTAALSGAVIISFSAILYRLADTDPVTAAVFRMAYAVPPLFLIWLWGRRRDERTPAMRSQALLAGFFLACDVVVWSNAIDRIGAGLATLIVNSQVVLVPFVTWALFGERPARRAVLAMPVVMAGLAAITGLGSDDTFGERPGLGVVMGIGAAIFYTAFLVTFRRAGRARAPAAGPLLDATAGAAITSFAVLLQPTLTLIWGRLIFDERAGSVQLAGVALVLGGIAAVTWRR